MISFSPNMLKTFTTCRRKYYLRYVIGLSVPQKSSIFEKGKKIHALANYFLRGDDISKLVTELTDEEKKVWNLLSQNEYFKKSYVNSEYNLSCKIADYWIGGRLDAVVKDENNIYILDYKTGSVPKEPENDYQTMIYLLCLDSFSKMSELNMPVNFVYIDLKNNKNHIISFDDEKRNKYITEITKICKEIEDYKPDENITRTQSCNFCEFKKFCK